MVVRKAAAYVGFGLMVGLLSCGGSESPIEATVPPSEPAGPVEPEPAVPCSPTNVVAAPGDGYNRISWAVVRETIRYFVYWTADGSDPSKTNGTRSADDFSPFIHTGVANGTEYRYVVSASNTVGEGQVSAVVSAIPFAPVLPPAAPSGVTAVPGDRMITIAWNLVTRAQSYNVYWTDDLSRPSRTHGSRIEDATPPTLHTGLTNYRTYIYVVAGLNTAGESPGSGPVFAIPLPTPSAPTNVTAIPREDGVEISWGAVTEATTYNLYWAGDGSTPSKTNGSRIEGVSSPYSHTGIQAGVVHRYVVTAENSIAEGPESIMMGGAPMWPTNMNGTEFIRVPPGEFMMGSHTNNPNGWINEYPVHLVRITSPFWLARYEVTVGQYRAFADATAYLGDSGSNWRDPGFAQGDDEPVAGVSWNDAKAYCSWWSLQSGVTCRLPTEAEWEYAARGVDGREHAWGNAPDPLRCNAYEPPFDDGYYYLAPVGAFSPAGDSCFGVCDMMGSLWEWCEDFYAEDYYAVSPVNDPQGPGTGLARSTRGGSFASPFEHCRSAERVGYNPWATTVVLGFRLLVPTTQ